MANQEVCAVVFLIQWGGGGTRAEEMKESLHEGEIRERACDERSKMR